jgi:hypothetical protein
MMLLLLVFAEDIGQLAHIGFMGNPRPRGAGDNAKVGSSPSPHRAERRAVQWPVEHRPSMTAQTCTDSELLSAPAFGKDQ